MTPEPDNAASLPSMGDAFDNLRRYARRCARTRSVARVCGLALMALRPALDAPLSAALQTTSSTTSYAAPHVPGLSLHRWTTGDGLPQVSVTSIVQTRDGYLWIGTFGGLARFDGIRFEVFNVADTPGLPTDRIVSLFEDRRGTLWIGGQRGLGRLRDGTFETLDLPRTPTIWGFAEGPDGEIWLATATGLFVDRGEGPEPVNVGGLDEGRGVAAVLATSDGALVAGLGSGVVVRLDGGKVHILGRLAGDETLWSIAEDPQGSIWLGSTRGRLFRVRDQHLVEVGALPHAHQINRLLFDHLGRLWLGCGDLWRGSEAGPAGTVQLQPLGVSSGGIRTIFEDTEDDLWVGTDLDGLIRLRPSAVVAPKGLPPGPVLGIAADHQGQVYASIQGQGLWRIAPGEAHRIPLEDRAGDPWMLTFTHDGAMWIGISRGLVSIAPDRSPVAEPEGVGTRAILETASGDLWVGGEHGLARIGADGEIRRWRPDTDLPPGAILALTEGPPGTVWAGTDYGLLRVEGEEVSSYSARNGLPRGQIRALYYDDQSLWMGSYGGGLGLLAGGSFSIFTTEDGLADNVVSSILEDDAGYLWMHGNRGAFRVAEHQLRDFAAGVADRIDAQLFDTGEGTGGFSPSSAVAADGTLWFPTVFGPRGVVPGRVSADVVPPRVAIEGVTQNGRSLRTVDGRFLIPRGADRNLEIRYTGLSFSEPEALRFSYQLVGYDEGWVDAGHRRTAYYTKLPPGHYTFRVRARSGAGVASLDEGDVAIVVRPHVWEHGWVPGLALLVLVTGIAGAYSVRLHSARERTRLLEQEIEERKRAQALLANMSHEIRTPMNAILGYTQLLQRDRSLGEAQKRQLEIVQHSGNHLLALIDDILEMSRLEAGRTTLAVEPFDLHALLLDVELMFRGLTGAKGLGLEVALDPGLPRSVVGDAGKVRQVVINLLSNAVKFTDAGRIEIRAESRRIAGERLEVTLRVEDTGCGIPSGSFDRIFDPFDQSEPGAHSGGTGLGLAISRSFARLMQGDVTVRSTIGRGSIFTFTFEAAETSAAPLPASEPTPLPVGLVPGQRRPKVLIVDDVATNRQLLNDLLSRLGFETAVAASGEEAIDQHASGPADLVLMDLRMPGMGGLEAIRRLRAEGFAAPILVITASVLSGEENLAVRSMANGCLRKPFREGDLLAWIGDALGIRYVYGFRDDLPLADAPAGPTDVPALADLVAELPSELVEQLRRAAIQARARQIAELADRVAEHSQPAAERIRRLAGSFQYETLLAALEAGTPR